MNLEPRSELKNMYLLGGLLNGRLYDPLIGRMFSPDPYVVDKTNSQDYNKYTYARNNPLTYVDPSGNIPILVPIIIGAVIGTYIGGSVANNNYNPARWNWRSGKTWGYMAGGAIVGAASGYIGGAVATSGMPMASTAGIASASFVNSVGTAIYTGGQTDVSISLGVASYNFTQSEWGYIGKRGNSALENIGYGLGALANASDASAGFSPSEVQLNTEKSDAIGHSALTKVGETDRHNSLISVGPDPSGKWIFNPFKFKNGTNDWENYVDAGSDVWRVGVKGINFERITNYGLSLNKGVNYNLYFSSCVSHTARALTLAGAPAIGLHPFILHSQMVLRSLGIRPILFSYHLYQ